MGLLALQPLEEVSDVTAGKKALHAQERHDPKAVTEERIYHWRRRIWFVAAILATDVSLSPHFVVQGTGGRHRFCSWALMSGTWMKQLGLQHLHCCPQEEHADSSAESS